MLLLIVKDVSSVNCIVLKNNLALFGTDINGAFAIDLKTDKYFQLPKTHIGRLYSIILESSGEYAISAGDDLNLCLWKLDADIKNIKCVYKIESGHDKPIRSLACLKKRRILLSAGNDNLIRYRTFNTKKSIINKNSFPLPKHHDDFVYSITVSADDRFVISGSTDKTIKIWDAESFEMISKGEEHSAFIWHVSSSPEVMNNQYFASSSSDGTIRIWNITEIPQNTDLESNIVFEVLPGIDIVGGDFSNAKIKNDKIKELIRMNGGIVS